MILAMFAVSRQFVSDSLNIIVTFWDDDCICTGCDSGPKSNVTGATTHNFDNKHALMRRCRVVDTIKCFRGYVNGSIKTNREISSWDADWVETEFRQFQSTMIRAITANNNQCIDTELLKLFDTFQLRFLFCKFWETCRIKDRTTTVDNAVKLMRLHLKDVPFNKAFITIIDTICFKSCVHRRTGNCTHGSVHTGWVAATCQNTNAFHFFTSSKNSVALHSPKTMLSLF